MSGLRHRCTTCGGSCQGVNVRLLDPDELARVVRLGQELAVAEPVVGNRLRQTEDGRCVFLDETHLCTLHARFGADAKPLICRQYPLVQLSTEAGQRRGIDPGCYSAFQTQT